MDDMSVSVVIPTLNAANRLPRLIEALNSQSIPLQEILIVDSSSEDGTATIAKGMPGVSVIVIEREAFNHGATRHAAALKTRGDFICFLTDDALPANDHFLAELVAPFKDELVAMSTGRQLPKPDARLFERLVRGFNYGPDSAVRSKCDIETYGIKTFFASDVCACYRRSAYLQCGGFEPVNTSEDMLMAFRFIDKGFKVAYVASAEVFHSHNLTAAQQFRRNREIGYFLEMHNAEFGNLSEIGEGRRLVSNVIGKLLHSHQIRESFSFCVDCLARFSGNRCGRRAARKDLRTQQKNSGDS